MTSVYLRPEAQVDLTETKRWYERQQVGLGARFENEVAHALARIESDPLTFPKVSGDTRRALVARFPYSIQYLAEPDRIVVLQIVHASRDTSHWWVSDGQAGVQAVFLSE